MKIFYIHTNFTESYADCYAAITMYLDNKDKNIFKTIYQFRKDAYEKQKKNNLFSIDDNGVIAKGGPLSISMYSNCLALEFIFNNIVNQVDKDKLFEMPITKLNDLIKI